MLEVQVRNGKSGRRLSMPKLAEQAESTLGHVKGAQRRLGNIGRMRSHKKEQRSVEALAAAALYRKAGVDTVLSALRDYRLACTDGRVSVPPKDAFKPEHCAWLYAGNA